MALYSDLFSLRLNLILPNTGIPHTDSEHAVAVQLVEDLMSAARRFVRRLSTTPVSGRYERFQ